MSDERGANAGRQSLGMRIGIGAALVVVPVGAVIGYLQLKSAGQRNNAAAEQGAAYDVDSLRRIDPSAIKYQQTGRIETGLKYARAIAVDRSGQILIAGDRKVRVLSSSGELRKEIGLEDYPSSVAGGDKEAVLVGFRDHVEVFGADGVRKVWGSFGANAQLTGLAVIGDEVYAADAGRRVVVRCDMEGKVIGEIGRRDEGRGEKGLVLPSPYLNVSGTAQGQVMVSNPGRHRVERYSADGELQGFFGSAGAGIAGFIGCCNPSQLALLNDGRIVTAEKGVARIKVYLPDGRLQGVVAGPELLGSGAHGFELAVDGAGRILVLERGGTEVRVFTEREAPTTKASEEKQDKNAAADRSGGGKL